MLTPQDIKKLSEYLIEVFKDIFATKEDLKEIYERLDVLQNSVDSLVIRMDTRDEEAIILNYRMKQAGNWIDKASPKLGIKFEH